MCQPDQDTVLEPFANAYDEEDRHGQMGEEPEDMAPSERNPHRDFLDS